MAGKDPRIKICPKCGAKNDGNNSHCDKCNWPLDVIIYQDD